MEPSLVTPLAILGGTGAILSWLLSSMRVKREHARFMRLHTTSVSQLADAAVEAMAVECGMDIEDAMKLLLKYAQERNPAFVGLIPKDFTAAREQIAKLRAEKEKRSASQSNS